MQKIFYKDMQEYSNADSKQEGNIFDESGSIGGSLAKKFVRVKNKYISKYIDILLHEDTSYVTSIDKFIKENYDTLTDELPLQYVSVLLKGRRQYMGLLENEVVGSKIANLLKVPSVYNELVWVGNSTKVMSLDFVKPGTEVSTLENGVYEQSKNGTIIQHEVGDFNNDFSSWEALIDAQFKGDNFTYNEIAYNSKAGKSLFDVCFDEKTRQKCKEQLKRDFVAEYLLRTMILDDADFYPRNVTVIQDKFQHKFYLGPANDFELILVPSANTSERMDFYDRNIRYLMEKYPKETMNFCNHFKEAFYPQGNLNRDLIEDLIIFNIPYKDTQQELISNLSTNIQNFDKYFMENYYDLKDKPYSACDRQK